MAVSCSRMLSRSYSHVPPLLTTSWRAYSPKSERYNPYPLLRPQPPGPIGLKNVVHINAHSPTSPYHRDLPLIDFTIETFLAEEDCLTKMLVLFYVHRLPTFSTLCDALARKGLCEPIIAGKPYSDHLGVCDYLKEKGAHVIFVPYDSHESFEESAYPKTAKKVISVAKEVYNPDQHEIVAVIDDGTALIPELNREKSQNPDLFKGARIIGFQQTQRGWIRLEKEKIPLQFPVIDYANSHFKTYEMPYVAEAVHRTLKSYLNDALTFFPRNCYIIGAGNLGANLHKRLLLDRDFTKVCIHDANPRNSLYRKNFFEELKNHDLLIGCTGRRALTVEQMHQYLHPTRPTVAVSASSSDIEFSGHEVRKKMPRSDDCHETYVLDNRIIIPLGGHPLPFYLPPKKALRYTTSFGTVNDIKFQVARAAKAGGLAQMLSLPEDTPPGPVAFDPDIQIALAREWTNWTSIY